MDEEEKKSEEPRVRTPIRKSEAPSVDQSSEAIRKKAMITYIVAGSLGVLLVALMTAAIVVGAIGLNSVPETGETPTHYEDGRAGYYDGNMLRIEEEGTPSGTIGLSFHEETGYYRIDELVPPERETACIAPRFEYRSGALARVAVVGDGEPLLEESSFLREIYFEAPLSEISDYAFQDAPIQAVHLTEGRLGNGLSIGEGAFKNSSLVEIDVPDALVGIGSEAFMGCASLLEMSLPVGVEEIGSSVFSGSGLDSLSFEGTRAAWSLVKKASDWAEGSSITEVTCTDGILKI